MLNKSLMVGASVVAVLTLIGACSTLELAQMPTDDPDGPGDPLAPDPDGSAPSARKVGDVRALAPAVIERTADGSYRQRVQSPGATLIKLHFQRLDAPPGARLDIADRSGTVVHQLRTDDIGSDGWAPSVRGDTAVVTLRSTSGGDGLPFVIDQYARGDVNMFGPQTDASWRPLTVCGANDFQSSACFGGTEFANSRAVARMLFVSQGSIFACTGWLASPNSHFLTNNHCIRNQAEATTLESWFDFETTTCNGSTMATATVIRGSTFLATSSALDYTLLQLPGGPAATFGFLRIDPRDLNTGDVFYLPQHPGGGPKVFAFSENGGRCTIRRTEQSVSGFAARANAGYTCDTEGGSSGSPVISPSSQQVIALHHLGGDCSASTNFGTYMRDIYPQIAGFLLPAGVQSFYRLRNDRIGDHFYTRFVGERDNAKSAFGFFNEGLAGFIFADPAFDRVALFRLYHSGTTDHLYTTSPAEVDNATRLGFSLESVAGYVYPVPAAGAIPLFRLYSGARGEHFYTTFPGERDAAVASGVFVSEGIAGYLPTF